MNPVTAGSTSSPFIVTRRFAVVAGDVGRVAQVAAEEDGIDNVEVDAAGRGVAIRYDTSRIGYADIEALLAAAGVSFRKGWWVSVRAAWSRYLDENARANAHSKGGTCCSNPVAIYGGRHRP